MKATATIQELPKEEKRETFDYPVLLRNTGSGSVVLFTSPGRGTLIIAKGAWAFGDYSCTWNTNGWEVLPKGTKIVLENG